MSERKFLCLFCDGECSLEYYKTEAVADELKALFSLWKVCITHEKEINDARELRRVKEIEKPAG